MLSKDMTRERLIKAAEKEDWDFVEVTIPKICDEPDYISWAVNKGLLERNRNLRDLAASILGKTHSSRFGEAAEKLRELMLSDNESCVRYRAAIALGNHEVRDYREEILKVLYEAKEYEETSVDAKSCLQKFK